MHCLPKYLRVLLLVPFSFGMRSGAQQVINGNRTMLGNWDASTALTTKPLKLGTSLPSSCGVGEMFFNTAAAAGANVYVCAGANTWTPILGSGSAGTVTNSAGPLTSDMPLFGAGGNDSKAGTKTGSGDQVVVSQSPTIVSPVIVDFTNMQHNHAGTSGGGQLGISAISPAAISGNGSKLASVAGTLTSGDCAKFDASGNIVDTGAACGGGGAISSVFGRTGAVAAQTGDYNFAQISGSVATAQLPASVEYAQTGAGAPLAGCTAGHNTYLDTTNLDFWFCDASSTWKKIIAATNSGSFSITGQNGASPCGTPATGQDCLYFGTNDTPHIVNAAGTDSAVIMGAGPESAAPSSNPAPGFENLWFSSKFNAPAALNSTGALFSMVQQDGSANYSGASFTAAGNIAAGSGSSAAGCVHVQDSAAVFDTTLCAPSTGTGVTLTGPSPTSTSGAGTSAGTIFTINGEPGGATTGSGTTAGNGAGISLTTGAGGSGSGGINASGGNGGAFLINTGAGGAASGSGTAGNPGPITLEQNGTSVFSAAGNGSLTVQAAASTAAATFKGGNDTAALASTLGPLVARGANVTGGATAGSAAGSATVQGGDNAATATSGAVTGGNLTLRPGQVTTNGAGSTAVNGTLQLEQAFIKGSTYTAGNLGCFSGSQTISDCTLAQNPQAAGVNAAANGNAATLITHGTASVNSASSAIFTAGDYVCADANNGAKAIDNGTTPCSGGQPQVGIVETTDGASGTSHAVLVSPRAPTALRAILTSAYTNSTTSMTSVSGLSFPVNANTNYIVTCQLMFKSSASTAALDLQFTGPSSPGALSLNLVETTTAGGPATFYANSVNALGSPAGPGSVGTTATDMPATVTLGLVNGPNAGTLVLQAKASGTGTVTIEAGSFCAMQ